MMSYSVHEIFLSDSGVGIVCLIVVGMEALSDGKAGPLRKIANDSYGDRYLFDPPLSGVS